MSQAKIHLFNMDNQFNSVLVQRPKRNVFDLSYMNRLSCEFGKLVNCYAQEYIPGDSFRMNSEILVKMSPALAPIMTEIDARVDFFRCDFHLVNDRAVEMILGDVDGQWSYPIQKITWNKLEDFVYQLCQASHSSFFARPEVISVLGYDLNDYTVAFDKYEILTKSLFGSGSLWDYVGLPSLRFFKTKQTGQTVELDSHTVSLQQLYANHGSKGIQPYEFLLNALIYNEYYRDQNVDSEIEIPRTYADINTWISAMATTYAERWFWIFVLKMRRQPKDYFTSALPDPQKGGTVSIPFSGSVDLSGVTGSIGSGSIRLDQVIDVYSQTPANGTLGAVNGGLEAASQTAELRNGTSVSVPLSGSAGLSITAATINELRRAEQLQKYLELSSRSGGRPGERIWANFAVKPSDSRLGRPEYLGGGKVPIVVSEVNSNQMTTFNSSGEATIDPLGTMAGHGTAVGSSPRFSAYFNDYGVVIGILTIIPKSGYFQGVPRRFQRFDPFEYYLPLFAQLGEQPIRNSEIYLSDSSSDDNDAEFGYTPRYAEYRFNNNEIHGLMRSSLLYWHTAREFGNLPTLSSEFLEINAVDYNKIFPVIASRSETHHFNVSIYNRCTALREVVKFNIPTL